MSVDPRDQNVSLPIQSDQPQQPPTEHQNRSMLSERSAVLMDESIVEIGQAHPLPDHLAAMRQLADPNALTKAHLGMYMEWTRISVLNLEHQINHQLTFLRALREHLKTLTSMYQALVQFCHPNRRHNRWRHLQEINVQMKQQLEPNRTQREHRGRTTPEQLLPAPTTLDDKGTPRNHINPPPTTDVGFDSIGHDVLGQRTPLNLFHIDIRLLVDTGRTNPSTATADCIYGTSLYSLFLSAMSVSSPPGQQPLTNHLMGYPQRESSKSSSNQGGKSSSQGGALYLLASGGIINLLVDETAFYLSFDQAWIRFEYLTATGIHLDPKSMKAFPERYQSDLKQNLRPHCHSPVNRVTVGGNAIKRHR
ncbi:hypothetical protein PROFUN_14589 [Planoprotostelium fungivorum]|uniref:Uncharacterized protein n=1 Tax=Planoprotostelium fungivorum TaxID=1890364 RepID=A0A2P6MZH2_9EUKA|nr:hypothetical protein PROFUN_14589 [Planoprotostelium fungivorum]